MTDRTAKILEQDKMVLRGLKARGKHIVMSLDDDETLDITLDWTPWLGTDTIASVSNTASGITVSGASNTTVSATFKVASTYSGWVEHRITTAAGLIKEKLILVEVNGFPLRDDYGVGWRVL
jgi:hypothetical protein